MFKIGIAGCGKIAQVRHIPEFSQNPHAQLHGYWNHSAPRARDMAQQYGGRVYENWQELVADEEIDAVCVCGANSTHAETTIAALEAGKHVLCEKPMATTLADCEAMVAAAKASGKFLMIAQNQRLAEAHVHAREMLKSGVIGRLLTFRTTFGHGGPEHWSGIPSRDTWFFDAKLAALGAMGDLGVHKTDLIHFITGQSVVEVTAKLDTLHKQSESGALVAVNDNALCIYRLSGGALGTMTASWTHYGEEDNSTVLYGTEGIMKIYHDPRFSIEVTRADGEKSFHQAGNIQTNEEQTHSGVVDTFMECLVNGVAPEISGEEALKAMRVVFAAVESSKSGCPVAVKHSSHPP